MEMQFTGRISSALKIDNPEFLVDNLERIKNDDNLKKSLLSLCLEHQAFNCFRYLAKNGFNEIYSISYGVALREDKQDILNIIHEFKLFDINGEKGKTLLNICVSNKDDKLFNKLKDIVTPSSDILMYALQGQNREAIEIYQRKGYSWETSTQETNPLIYIYEIYQSNKKAFIKTILESHQKNEILNFAENHFQANGELEIFQKLLPKNK